MAAANVAQHAADLPPYMALVLSGLSILVTAVLTYKKGGDRPAISAENAATQVVAATFTERGQMERLIGAVSALDTSVRASNDGTDKLVKLLLAEAHRRELQAEVEDELRKRGIRE